MEIQDLEHLSFPIYLQQTQNVRSENVLFSLSQKILDSVKPPSPTNTELTRREFKESRTTELV